MRHGEQQDAEHGLPDGPLSPKGQRQARAIADRLGFDLVSHRLELFEQSGLLWFNDLQGAKAGVDLLGKPLVDKVDFELWSMAVSSIIRTLLNH